MGFLIHELWCNYYIFEGFWFGAIAIDENREVSDMTLENQDQNKKLNLGLFVLSVFAFASTFFLFFFF